MNTTLALTTLTLIRLVLPFVLLIIIGTLVNNRKVELN